MPVENRLQPRGLDLAPFQPQNDAIEHHQLVFDPAQPALNPLEPALDRAAGLGLAALPAHLRGGHYLGLRFLEGAPARLPERLAAEQVYVSLRGDSLRVTPHLYKDAADVDRLFEVLRAAL